MAGPRLRTARTRTDWFRVLADLQYAGLPNADVAKTIEVPVATLRGWKGGSEPSHANGHTLLELWSIATGKTIDDRPMTLD